MTYEVSGYGNIPDYTLAALQRYVEHHIPPGGFLRSVLENDLKESLGRADGNNRFALFYIVSWLYNEAPMTCWGSPENVEAWLSSVKEEQRP